MNDIRELVVRKKLQNLILNFILIIFCFINIILNIDNYKKILSNNFDTISSISQLDKAKKDNNLFIYIDLQDAKMQNYSIKNKLNKANIYTLNMDDKNILVILRENTILTDKTPVKIINDSDIISDIKNKLKDNDYYEISLSNVDYNDDKIIELYKIYALFLILSLSTLFIFIDLFGIFIPSNTIMYKKYKKKYY